MTTISNTITIKAPISSVWNILMNFEAYSDWNTFIPKIAFRNLEKNSLEVLISPPNGSAMTCKPLVISNKKEQEFIWKGKLFIKGLFDGTHGFKLCASENGHTIFTQEESFTGILVPLFKKSLETKTLAGFIAMNKALKERAESSC